MVRRIRYIGKNSMALLGLELMIFSLSRSGNPIHPLKGKDGKRFSPLTSNLHLPMTTICYLGPWKCWLLIFWVLSTGALKSATFHSSLHFLFTTKNREALKTVLFLITIPIVPRRAAYLYLWPPYIRFLFLHTSTLKMVGAHFSEMPASAYKYDWESPQTIIPHSEFIN